MSVSPVVLVPTKYAENSTTVQYVPSGKRAIIDRMTATNNSGAACEFSVWIVTNGSTPGGQNRLLNRRSIDPGQSYSCPEVTGHVLLNGDALTTLAATSASITIRVSGREMG